MLVKRTHTHTHKHTLDGSSIKSVAFYAPKRLTSAHLISWWARREANKKNTTQNTGPHTTTTNSKNLPIRQRQVKNGISEEVEYPSTWFSTEVEEFQHRQTMLANKVNPFQTGSANMSWRNANTTGRKGYPLHILLEYHKPANFIGRMNIPTLLPSCLLVNGFRHATKWLLPHVPTRIAETAFVGGEK